MYTGDGVYQRGVNYCIQKLNEGNWIHVFPEGMYDSAICYYVCILYTVLISWYTCTLICFVFYLGKVNMTEGPLRLKWGN